MQRKPLSLSQRSAITLLAASIALPVFSSISVAQDALELPEEPAETIEEAAEEAVDAEVLAPLPEEALDYSSLAQREMIRRQNAVYEADQLLLAGRIAYREGDFQKAADKYSQALQMVPEAPMFADRKQALTAHLTDANVALAMQHREVGKTDEARTLLENVRDLDPENKLALQELEYLDDPYRTNPKLTPAHVEDVKKVKRALTAAQSSYDLGKYDDAREEFHNVLRIDPFNKAARRGLERVAGIKSDYYRAAYDQTRAELLMQVDKAWEMTIPSNVPQGAFRQRKGSDTSTGVALITEKLRRIIIPRIDFEDTTVEEAIAFLRQRSVELDPIAMNQEDKGVNFVVRRPNNGGGGGGGLIDEGLDGLGVGGGGNDPNSMIIKELRVRNVPLQVALKYICDATKLRYKVDDYAVTLVPQTETGEEIFTRNFTVPPDFHSQLDTGGGAAAADPDPFADPVGGGANAITPRAPIKDLLEKTGVAFNDGTSATLTGSVLLVTNTPTELDKIEQLVDNIANSQPKQVKITTKFVEITQENGEELGFDWVIGPFFSGDGNLAAAGGTIGSGGTRTGLDFSGPLISGVPGSDTNVSNIVTAGNRSGDLANSRNSIDAILNNTSRATQSPRVAPGIMSLTGLFSEGQLKVIMRGLNQKKGTDLMTAPSITARSGDKATIEIIREFIYPTEYDPPELPGGGGGNQNNVQPADGEQAAVQAFPVTPANPTAFETRNTGVTLEIEPNFGDDNMIDLRFVPEIVEFEGFINYGSPIQTAGTDGDGNPVQVVITENRIEMPIFSTRRVNTALTIYDGYTVAIGGLMREDVQNVEDSVPILGDLPLIGRLFQTKAENRIKSNLIIFVTAQIIDPTGRPLRGGDEVTPDIGGPEPGL